jgi:multidrug efflux pump subunit AcrA (membrane-fusion protein)
MDEPPTRTRRPLAIVLVGLVVVSSSAWIVGTRLGDARPGGGPPPAPARLTATVERRSLTSSVIARGDAAPRASITIGAPSSVEGTPVVSAPAVRPGDTIVEGQRIIEVSGRPVMALVGAVPAYRTMRPGQQGADIGQLQAALSRLGLPSDGDGTYGARTKQGVAALYQAHGYDAPTASPGEAAELAEADRGVEVARATLRSAERDLALARRGASEQDRRAADAAVAAAQRAERVAVAQRDADVERARLDADAASERAQRLDADPGADPDERANAEVEAAHATAAISLAQASGDAAVADAADRRALAEAARADLDRPIEVADQTAAEDQARAALEGAVLASEALHRTTGPVVPQGEVVFVPTGPARVDQAGIAPSTRSSEEAGAAGGGTRPLLVLATGGIEVVALVPPDEAGDLRPGDSAELLDDSTGERRTGAVAAVDPVAAGDQGPVRAVHLVGEALPDAWSGINLRVTFRTPMTAGPVLVAPASAVSSSADGRTRVRVVIGRRAPRTVVVDVGASGDGFVELRPEDGELRAGDRVVVGR